LYVKIPGVSPRLIDPVNLNMIELAKKESIKEWDPVAILKPPKNLSFESGKIWMKEECSPGDGDYKMVEKKFLDTFLIKK